MAGKAAARSKGVGVGLRSNPANPGKKRSYSTFFSHAFILSDAVAELSDATLEFSAGGNWRLPWSDS